MNVLYLNKSHLGRLRQTHLGRAKDSGRIKYDTLPRADIYFFLSCEEPILKGAPPL